MLGFLFFFYFLFFSNSTGVSNTTYGGYMSIVVNHLFNGDEKFDVYIDSNTNNIKVIFIINGNENICEYDYDEFMTIMKKNGWKLEKPYVSKVSE